MTSQTAGSARDDGTAPDPYHPPSGAQNSTEVPVSRTLLAVALGLTVACAAAVTLTAFLFGILVAVSGQLQPPPVNFSAVMSQRHGRLIIAGGVVVIALGSLSLGWYSGMKLLHNARKSSDMQHRRQQLTRALAEYRRSQADTRQP
jgi:hypothetical protein